MARDTWHTDVPAALRLQDDVRRQAERDVTWQPLPGGPRVLQPQAHGTPHAPPLPGGGWQVVGDGRQVAGDNWRRQVLFVGYSCQLVGDKGR